MLNPKKILSSLLISSLLITLVPSTVFANHTRQDISNNASFFTPDNRATVQYRDPLDGGVTGLNYPSFNNFINNPNIPGDRKKDERLFLLGQHCEDGNCNRRDGIFYNTTDGVEAGDRVMFSLYFHNNADDPHKAGGADTEPARNVRIGVDLLNIVDHTADDFLRPKGFIIADNAEYRTNINNENTAIRVPVTNVKVNKITDDMQVPIMQEGMELAFVPNSARVKFNPENIIEHSANANQVVGDKIPVDANLRVVLRTDDGTEVEVNARTTLSDDRKTMWITFDELPGCFRYSGFVYFEAEVVAPPVEPEPNICEALSATVFGGPREMPNGKMAFPIAIDQARFREEIPVNSRILWESPNDPNGEFYRSEVVNGQSVFTLLRDRGNLITPFNTDQVLFYAGTGPVNVSISGVNEPLANRDVCEDSVTIPEIPDEPSFCTSLDIVDNSYQKQKLASGKTQHRFVVNNPTFSDSVIPANTKIRVKTTNNNGTFKVFSTSVFPPTFVDLPEVARNTVEVTTNNQSKIFLYINDGTVDTITTSLNPAALNNNLCTDNLTTEIIPEAPVCREIVVSYQDPIYEGTETLFSAESFYENGGQFAEGKIRYSVDEGHGTFSNRENPQAPNNPAPRPRVEIDFEPNDVQFDFNAMVDDEPIEVPARPAERVDRPILDIRQNIQNPFGEIIIPDIVANFGLNQPVAPNQGIQLEGLIQNRVRLDQDQLPRRNFFNSVLNADAATAINNNNENLRINQRVLADNQVNEGLSVLADPNEGVFLNATRAGNQVVHVDQLDEDGNVIPQCSADFNIIGVRCQNLAYEIDGVQNAPTIDRGEIHTIRAAARFSGVPDPVGNNITYTIDARYGAFIENEQALPALATIQPLTKANIEAALRSANLVPEAILKSEVTRTSGPIDFRIVIYADAPQDGGAVINITSTKDGQNCNAKIQVLPNIPELPACIETKYDLTHYKYFSPIVPLSLEVTQKIERNSMYRVLVKSTFVNEAAIPANQKKLKVSIPAEYGAFINPNNAATNNEPVLRLIAALQQSPSFNAQTLNAFAAQLTNGADLVQQSVLVDPSQTLIVLTYGGAPNAASAIKIEQVGFEQICKAEIPIPENIEKVCTELKFDGSFDPKNRLTEMKIRVDKFPKTGIKVTTNGECKVSKLSNNNGTDEINFVEGEELKFYIICDNYNPATDTVEITADGGANCKQQIKVLPTPPPAQPEICVDLDITTPDEPWDIEEDDDRQNFEIAVQTNPANLRNNFYYHFEVTDGAGTWADNDRKKVSTRGDLTQTLEDFDEDTRVTVFASSDADGQNTFAACRDSIRPRLEDRPNPPSDEPEIEKVVYPKSEIDDADDQINIAGRDRMPYVTYMAAFTPGSKTKSVEIEENSLRNGSIRGNLNGELEFKAMEIIAIEDFRDEEGEIIFRSNLYKEDDSRNSAGDKYYDYDDDEDYDCEDRGNRFCIEDFEDLEENFKKGEAIRFDNVDKLGSDGRIIIKYQMTNKSEIDEDQCQKLRSSSGCGEQFDNTIEYTSYERTEWNDREDSGKDSAEVIVICPYILARQGGDSLMYKGFDLGVDISTCSPVKGSDGIGIEIIPEEEERIPSTGTGDEAAALLELPSHDICNFSNNENNIASYQNALENFSSTVCELEAKVAEELYEENINKAIAANIGRLARFGDNLTIKNLNSVAQLNNLENSQSGVFIKTNGDLTIDGGANGYKIEKTTEVRAAQTYIIRGHDLIINSDVIYGPTNFTDPRNIPSVAFIVIDGNIIIDENVERLDGIYMAVNLSDKEGLGEISGSAKSEKRLTIHGSLIGNVYKLFRDRIAIGDPRKDEGAVTIKYDERILLNTPPGIGELVDIKQVIVP